MVHGTPWRLRCGLLFLFTLLCAHTPLQAQNLFGGIESLLGGSSEPATSEPPTTTGALLSNQQRTRFVIGLPKTTEFEVFSLTNPNRVVVQLTETKLRLPEQPKASPIGLIKSFQAGLAGTERSRVIIYVTEPVIVSSARIEKTKDGNSQHLVIEIASFVPVTAGIPPVKQKAAMTPPPFALGGAGLQPPLPRPAVSPDVLAQRAFKPIIVIDPGHGGHDSGAEKNGAVEKDITLAFSKILAKKLNATGRFKVMMTRDEDVFIPLGDRISFGEKNKANLFIAVHCDYADTGSTASGATIYSLRDSVADSLRRSTRGDVASKVLSKNEVEKVKQASDGEDVSLVKGILSDLAEREVDATQDRTSVFARTVIETMGASTTMRNKPDQQASFRVLKTAQFPSVLIELAYVTNKQDAANLQSDAWRDKVTDSILTAIDNYFSNQVAQLPM
ncbi:MAG TPA: N-acetylmuramoyl-L-alanine amidase [Hyphomicrobium sp.]|jgi:N-acetylmuramoyl-L-alanine amidase